MKLTENPSTFADVEPSLYEKNKLRIAGALNAVGDVALVLDGWKSKSIPFKLAGWLYAAGAVVVTLFGTSNKAQHVQDVTERAAEFVQTKSIEKPQGLESSEILKNRDNGIIASTGRFLRRHSAQVMLALYTLGAGAMLTHGIKAYRGVDASDKSGKKEAMSEVWVGATSLLVKAASLLVPEKANTASNENNTKSKGALEWLKEKPMRLFGLGSLATESFWAYRAYMKKQNGKPWQKSAVIAGSYMLSDIVIATTNKDAANAVGKMTDHEQARLENMMAETIAVQPEEKRAELAADAADFLQKESIVKGSKEQLRESLLSRANQLWSERSNQPSQSLNIA